MTRRRDLLKMAGVGIAGASVLPGTAAGRTQFQRDHELSADETIWQLGELDGSTDGFVEYEDAADSI